MNWGDAAIAWMLLCSLLGTAVLITALCRAAYAWFCAALDGAARDVWR